jgi:hypothetical protein
MEKICKTCKTKKLIEFFGKNGNRYGKQEYHPSCRECYNKKASEYQRKKYKVKEKRWDIEFSEKDGNKKCKQCYLIKAIAEFPKRYSQDIGYRGVCKSCTAPFERERSHIRLLRDVQELNNRYLKSKFVRGLGISTTEVPQEYIELTRKSLRMYRIVKSKINN